MTQTKDALGNTTVYSYNPQTNVLESVQYPNGASTATVYSYDSMYRQISAAAGTGAAGGNQTLTANYTYTNDQLTKIVTGSTTYNFTYGSFGLPQQIKVGSQTLATYAYTNLKDKNLQKLTYGNGDYVSYLYDEYSRVTKETYEDGKYVAYRYDNDGFLTSVQDSETGRITSYSYDLSGRLAKYREKDSSLDHSVAYRYDQKNNLSKQTEKIGSATYTTDYSYDEDNRIKNLTSDLGTADTADDLTVVYSYDALGRLDKQELKKSTAADAETANGFITREYTYRENADGSKTTGQVAELEITTPGYSITYGYTYDANGNITKVTQGNTDTKYTYDSQNQLIREDNRAAGKSWTWTYDDAGNILSKKEYAYTTGTLGSVQSTISYGYTDANWKDKLTSYGGNQISYDLSGNMLSDGTWTYTWKHGRELASMSGNGTAWSFTYGADGMRTKREGSMGKTYNYVYNGSQLTRMTVGSNTLTFTYDASGIPVSVKFNNTVYYYETNLQGDVTAIVDGNGEIVAYYNYDAWGKDLSEEDSNSVIVFNTIGTLNPLRYRGYVYDTETGLYYVSSRYYDPEIGRFINADDVDLLGANGDFASLNLFAYCGNNPVSRADSNGYFWNTVIGAVAGAIVGGVSAALSGTDITAGIVSGALSGAISGAAVDIAIATGGVGLVALAGVTLASGAGGAASSYVNQRMNGKSHDEVDWGTVAIDGVWGAVGGALSFGTADVGGKMCKSLAENLALKGKAFWSQAGSDFVTTLTIAAGTWLNGTKMNLLKEGKATVIPMY